MSLWLSNFNEVFLKPPALVWEWMATKTSLTEKAKTTYQTVHLQLLNEQWQNIEKTRVFIREINMLCDEKLGWYARTWIPRETYACRAEQFKQLKEKPLATILYHDAHIVRSDVVFANLHPSTMEYQWAIKHYEGKKIPTSLWSRKSTFLIDWKPLYLMEAFFPDMFGEKYDI